MAHDVFICYSRHDKPTADSVCTALESSGLRCWIAPRDILPGQDWGDAIIRAITQSRTMVVVFSSHANGSPQVKREVERATNKGIPIIPFRIENTSPSGTLEYYLGITQWLEAYDSPLEQHLEKLVEGIQLLLSIDESPIDIHQKPGETPTAEQGSNLKEDSAPLKSTGRPTPEPERAASYSQETPSRMEVSTSKFISALKTAIEYIDNKRTQADILNALTEHASNIAPRVAFFVIRDGKAVGWSAKGLGNISDNAIRVISFPLSTKTLFRNVVELKSTWTGPPGVNADDRLLLEKLGNLSPKLMAAVPLIVGGKVVGALYADTAGLSNSKINIDALEILVRVTSMAVGLLAIRR